MIVIIWLVFYLAMTRVIRVQPRWDFAVAMSSLLVVLVPYFLFFERAKVLERCGFRCRQCGYDLRGQVTPRCPECGRALDDAEIAQMRLADPDDFSQPLAKPRGRFAWIAIVLLLALVLAQGVFVYLTTSRWQQQAAPATIAKPSTAPAESSAP